MSFNTPSSPYLIPTHLCVSPALYICCSLNYESFIKTSVVNASGQYWATWHSVVHLKLCWAGSDNTSFQGFFLQIRTYSVLIPFIKLMAVVLCYHLDHFVRVSLYIGSSAEMCIYTVYSILWLLFCSGNRNLSCP